MNNTTLATKRLESLTRVHLDSYNFAISQGFYFLNFYINSFIGQKTLIKKEKLNFNVFGIHVLGPKFYLKHRKIKKIPRHCRELKISYNGDCLLGLTFSTEKTHTKSFIMKIGDIPIMVRSAKCNLYHHKKKQLVEIDEEEIDIGGYFIINGMEKMLRLLIVPKKNLCLALSRLTNVSRGNLCTSLSCSVRSVDRMQKSRTLHLHYLTTGGIHARIIVQKKEFFIPIIILIKALITISDQSIIETIGIIFENDKFFRYRIMTMIKDAHQKCDLKDRQKILNFLGQIFQVLIPLENLQPELIAENFLSNHLLIHLGEDNKGKVDLLFYMITKLLSVQKGKSLEDNPDSITSQEFLLPGHLITVYFREKFESTVNNIFSFDKTEIAIVEYGKNQKNKIENIFSQKLFKRLFVSVTNGLSQIISTGSFVSKFNQELSQNSGLSVSVERANFGRFLSYFRSVHRGKFFFELKNTSGRKLLSQSWGFFCPVHTPDGALCGILNHLSSSVIISLSNPFDNNNLIKYFSRYLPKKWNKKSILHYNPFIIDGKILRTIPKSCFTNLADKLRLEKVSTIGKLSMGCEILLIPRSHKKSHLEGCILLSQEARPLRPVRWVNERKIMKTDHHSRRKNKDFRNYRSEIEIIGTLEQCFLNINNLDYQMPFFVKQIAGSHTEIEASNILSVIAGATPFSDLNQSPRNMYQCQMSKQSVGTPFYTFWRRDDIKSFFLLHPQVPICRNKIIQDGLQLDAFPNGFNAIVSVITYTGFDMEDAMIINKSSVQRGFSISNLYNSFDLEMKKIPSLTESTFSPFINEEKSLNVGNLLTKGQPIFPCVFTSSSSKKTESFFCYNSSEKAVVEQLKIFSETESKQKAERNVIKLRSRRRPIVGDKFASRHGQKGVFSYNFPSIDLPFSGTGMNPEIIFNPHGFPSRMTIGVIIESIIGKTGALDGTFHDSTPFRYGQNRAAVYHFGEKLRKSGFQFFGNEILYSGYSGAPFSMDIFLGIVNYQRLRHMVLDKYQVSNQGPKNSLTRQPIKGKKAGGSIRFGEMERDAILGQGCVFLLHDRLHTSSDLHGLELNAANGNIFNQTKKQNSRILQDRNVYTKTLTNRKVLIPYVIKFLANELNCLNIKTIISMT